MAISLGFLKGKGNAIGAIGGTAIKLWAGHQANKKIQENIKMFQNTVNKYQDRQASDDAYYNAIANEDAASNANTMAAVNAANEINQQNNEQARAQQILTGGSDESAALAKQQGAQTIGNMLNNAAVQNMQRQQQAHQTGAENWMAYQKATDAVNNQIAAARTGQAQNTVNMGDAAAKGFAKAAKNI